MSEPSLELHFDVNKTVLVDDKVQGIDAWTACNQILYWSSWGHLEEGRWRWDGREPCIDSDDPDALLFGHFAASDEALRTQRRGVRDNFTAEGFPGHALRPHYQDMLDALTLDGPAQATLADLEWAEPAGLHGEFVRLLPSFFRLLIDLGARGRKFALVFRTFGSDIPEIAVELNAFCRGEHPAHPGVRFDGSSGGLDLRLDLDDPSRFGSAHRGGEAGCEAEPVCFALGVLDRPDAADETPHNNPLGFYRGRTTSVLGSLDAFHQHLRSGGAFAFRDDYSGWARARFRSSAGKPMAVDLSDQDTVRVFFDDNIRHDSAHIVDLRDARSGEPVPFEDGIGRCLLRVDPHRAVTDDRYFIDALAGCLARR